jgi:hypothetical protein
MIGGLLETESCCGMDVNVDKNKVVKISRKPSPIQIMID